MHQDLLDCNQIKISIFGILHYSGDSALAEVLVNSHQSDVDLIFRAATVGPYRQRMTAVTSMYLEVRRLLFPGVAVASHERALRDIKAN